MPERGRQRNLSECKIGATSVSASGYSESAALYKTDDLIPLLLIGPHTYSQRPRIMRYAGDFQPVIIGDYCSISGGAEMLPGGNHNLYWISPFPLRWHFKLPGALEDGLPSSHRPVSIGNDVWIGRAAMMLSGATITDGAVVAARAVVATDVGPYAVVVGIPGREVRRRFDDTTVDHLRKLKRWNWSERVVREVTPLLCSYHLSDFFDPADSYADGPTTAEAGSLMIS